MGYKFSLESAKRRIYCINETRLPNDLLIKSLIAILYLQYTDK